MDNSYLDNVESTITTLFVKTILDTLDLDNSKKVLENVKKNLYSETFQNFLTENCIKNILLTCNKIVMLERLELLKNGNVN